MLSERKYSVSEIDRMRRSARMIAELGVGRREVTQAEVEEQLRTYMIASADPDELAAHADAVLDAYKAKRAARKALSEASNG